MSSEIVFEDRSDLNVLTMDMFDLADCCRACLRIECSLTATNSSDNDSIKLCDKLAACVSEIMWLKEGAPSLICTACIEKLRIAYDFRNACLQSEHTLQRYANQIQVEAKQQNSINNRPLVTPTKFEFTISNVAQEGLPCIIEEPQNQEYLHLKHFLDTNGELLKSEQIVETTQTSRSSTPDQRNTTTFISDHHVQTIDTIESQIETPQLQEAYTETDSVESQEVSLQLTNQTEHLHNQNKVEVLQQPQPQQKQEVQLAIHHLNSRVVITKTTGVQVRPPSPPRDSHEAGGKPFRCTVVLNNQFHSIKNKSKKRKEEERLGHGAGHLIGP
ncbi:Zinc-finger associated domain (zf-AD) [Popillia japonica]|uniref:Zinc-finger associated domain (Zf-AD) n=1 Tax=Popillia japonica TaxID=7064 RepID=A0AAW1KHF8_POPJA